MSFVALSSHSRSSSSSSSRARVLALASAAAALLVACGRASVPSAPDDASASAPASASASASTSASTSAPAPAPARIDPDGDDEAQELGEGTLPASLSLVRVGVPPLALSRICDLSSFGGALYMAHAVAPLGIDGATVTKYVAGDPTPLRLVFDWNRYGEPSRGGGAGQGFVRVHAIGGRLFVPDADPPYDGFGYLDHGTEGYVFVSDPSGAFAKPLGEHRKPPLAPTLAGDDGGAARAGAMVLPRAYHVLDVIRFRGALWASTGSVPPNERAWSGPSPGALHRADGASTRMDWVVGYPDDATRDVWRLTFLVRFHDRLFAGIQEYQPRDPNDYVVFSPAADATTITRADLRPVRATDAGVVSTLRWYADTKMETLYWIALGRTTGQAELRVTHDGFTWTSIEMPAGAGQPTDVVRFRDALVLLAENGLYRVEGTRVLPTPLATWTDPKLFAVSDWFCAAPLAVHQNALYAGSQKNGALYRFE